MLLQNHCILLQKQINNTTVSDTQKYADVNYKWEHVWEGKKKMFHLVNNV